MEEFKKLGLSKNSLKALEKKGITKPTTIQAKVIPLLLEGTLDVVGQSQTGTGKTAAFGLPILEIIGERNKNVQAIILTPTRELALQVAQEIGSLKGDKDIRILPVYGGAPIGPQRDALRKGVDIVVGTPGRVIDLQDRKSLRLNDIKYAVLDEADEMLNMGFVEDIENILRSTPKEKIMLLFSATMPKPILKIAQRYMRKYEFIETEKTQVITSNVEQIYYDINARDRVEGLRRIIDYYMGFYGIIFCNTKATVDTLTHQLTKMNYSAAALHGDITQGQREKILQQFRNKYVKILIATDVAARGIDVNDLTHVINFTLPQSPESYVHRIGRTGRAGKKGISITFVVPSERRKLSFVERINKCKLKKQKLPSAKDIIKNKELQVRVKIKDIIERSVGKSSKYNSMAEEFLNEYNPGEIISAILKYSFKNELEPSSYKEISEAKSSEKSSSRKGSRLRGRDSRSRSKSGSRGSDGRSSKRSDDRDSRSRSSDRRSSRDGLRSRSDGKGFSDRRKSDGRFSGRSDERRSRFKSDDKRSRKKSNERSSSDRKEKRYRKPSSR